MKKPLKRAEARSFCLDESDIQKLIENATDIRDRLVIQLLAYTGARRKEIVLLKVSNLDLEHNRIYMPTVKRRGDPQENLRQIPIISQRMKQDIITYLDLWKTKYNLRPEHGLLQQRSTSKKDGLTSVRINQIVADIAERAGVRSPNPNRLHLNPHIFRHSFARIARRKGVNFKVIQQIMGHASIATTFDLYGVPDWHELQEELSGKMMDFTQNKEVKK